ncbi:hypothetical protein CAOG_02739 [Capsaspora owczarzaki ATCC 30864]|uniref:Uncharacterized protein n=1 Tax=Capsaspora owczarzaki (strain ATCC 30864) TaxID=595528 RepID=A0A0D2U9B3_CAPO3|nr:hypothetical protein CAOG_02739 [Capsaspora owczarzaki ATCC 30864]KJE91626.1 hypothetical protein CAOG_002739 [Capsaspora owczarzaki ATCC 30864]|eukprot:XP_004349489.1 hypothetical protein CAOG_02739 [Capsaspora owczarzaki ATCC 30864]
MEHLAAAFQHIGLDRRINILAVSYTGPAVLPSASPGRASQPLQQLQQQQQPAAPSLLLAASNLPETAAVAGGVSAAEREQHIRALYAAREWPVPLPEPSSNETRATSTRDKQQQARTSLVDAVAAAIIPKQSTTAVSPSEAPELAPSSKAELLLARLVQHNLVSVAAFASCNSSLSSSTRQAPSGEEQQQQIADQVRRHAVAHDCTVYTSSVSLKLEVDPLTDGPEDGQFRIRRSHSLGFHIVNAPDLPHPSLIGPLIGQLSSDASKTAEGAIHCCWLFVSAARPFLSQHDMELARLVDSKLCPVVVVLVGSSPDPTYTRNLQHVFRHVIVLQSPRVPIPRSASDSFARGSGFFEGAFGDANDWGRLHSGLDVLLFKSVGAAIEMAVYYETRERPKSLHSSLHWFGALLGWYAVNIPVAARILTRILGIISRRLPASWAPIFHRFVAATLLYFASKNLTLLVATQQEHHLRQYATAAMQQIGNYWPRLINHAVLQRTARSETPPSAVAPSPEPPQPILALWVLLLLGRASLSARQQ